MSYDPVKDFDSLWFRTERSLRGELIEEWYESRPHVVRLAKHMWRARKLGNEVFEVSPRDWTRLCDRYRNCCAYCGRADALLSIDHIVPLSRGGRHHIGNLLPACEKCNVHKKDRYISEWYRARWRRKRRGA